MSLKRLLHYEFQLSTSSRSKGLFLEQGFWGEAFDMRPQKLNKKTMQTSPESLNFQLSELCIKRPRGILVTINRPVVKIKMPHSGVARITCALGQEIFLCPLSTKTTEFEVKNRSKSAGRIKNRTFTAVIF